jgi:hypothetical protein
MLAYAEELVRLEAEANGGLGRTDGQRRLFDMLGKEQQALVMDDSPLIAADPGRRAGKTTAFFGKAERACERRDAAKIFYFAPSNEQGFDIVWDDLIRHNHDFKLGWEALKADKCFRRGAAKIELFGYYSRRDVERARGTHSDLVWIDEAGLLPDWAEYFIEDVIQPTTIDYLGQIVLSGTPSIAAGGFFFDAIHALEGWSNKHHWTAEQNPFFKGRDVFAEVCARFNLTRDSIKFRREWLAEWIIDPDDLVYAVPNSAIRTSPPGEKWYSNVIGLDLGWRDHDAISVVGVEANRRTSHLRHIETKGQQTNHQLFRRILELQERFPGPVVYDPAGHATKKTIETFRIDAPAIHWVQAEKVRKVEFIQLLNDDLREGLTTVETDSPMLKEARRLKWKRPGQLATDAEHSDPGDAWLYAWRKARDSLREQREPVEQMVASTPYLEFLAREKAKQGNIVMRGTRQAQRFNKRAFN